MATCAVIPAYNEEKTIQEVVQRTLPFVQQVIVVDDGSRDHTFERAKAMGVIVLRHDINMGKGAALKTGCDYAVRKGAEQLVVLDADGQHDPEEIPQFIEALSHYDIVFGARQFSTEMPGVLKMGNRGLNLLVRALYHIKLQDTQSGFRAFTAETYQKIRWQATDYCMESEMIANAGKQRIRYIELPIKTTYLDRYKGTTVLDGLKIGLNLVFWRLRQ
jgi:glycosyltransferase involved in cell wall biosynthesis